MRSVKSICTLLTVLVVLASCQKEIGFENGTPDPGGNTGNGGTDAGNIVGVYDFVGSTSQTTADITAVTSGVTMRTVTSSYFISKNNAGTVTITANQMSSNDISYDVDTTMTVKIYMGGLLLSDDVMPFQTSVPSSSATADYTRNSSDSITTTGGLTTTPTQGPINMPNQVGMKLSWAGDILKLKSTMNVTQAIPAQNASMIASVVTEMRLRKRP